MYVASKTPNNKRNHKFTKFESNMMQTQENRVWKPHKQVVITSHSIGNMHSNKIKAATNKQGGQKVEGTRMLLKHATCKQDRQICKHKLL